MTDELADIRRQAAFLIYTLAAPEREERFPGIAGLADIICAAPLPGQAGMSPALDALMSLGDLRFAPYLASISKNFLRTALRNSWKGRRPFRPNWAATGCWTFWMSMRNFPPRWPACWLPCPAGPGRCWM